MSDLRSNWQRRLLHGLAALLLIDVGALFVLGITGYLYEELTASLMLGAVFTVISIAAVTLMRRGCNVIVMASVIVLSYAACGLAVRALFIGYAYGNEFEALLRQLAWTMTILAILMVYRGGMRQFDAKSRSMRFSRNGVMLAALVFAILLLLLIWLGDTLLASTLTRRWIIESIIMMVMVFLGTITLVGPSVVRLLDRREKKRFAKADAALTKQASFEMECPHCVQPLTLSVGPGRCDSCGFSCLVELEEPRCECGYLIYEHTSERCPECGRVIPEQDRWAEVPGNPP